MKNIKITNMENGSVIIVTKDVFNTMKNNLSEDSVYEETDEKTTTEQLMKAARQINSNCIYRFFQSMYDSYNLLKAKGEL